MKRIFLQIKDVQANKRFIVGLDDEGNPYFEGELPAAIAYDQAQMVCDMKESINVGEEIIFSVIFDPCLMKSIIKYSS